MRKNPVLKYLALLAAALFFVACGNKGDLYLPDEPADKQELQQSLTSHS